MDKSKILRPAIWLCVVAGFFLIYFAGLGSNPLTDPDEAVYGQVSKEMVQTGEWLSPHYAGKLWFDKPPLFYWLGAASEEVFGVNELGARFPSALMALAVVAFVFFLAKHDFGKKCAIIASLIMATCIQQIILARASVTDMTLVFCLIGALYFYRRWLDDGASSLFMIGCGAFTGLGMLAKGPVAPVLLLVTFIAHLIWIGKIKRVFSFGFALAVVSALVVGLPWYIAMYVMHKDEFVQGFLMANNVTRFLKPEHADITGAWYSVFMNFPVLLAFFFPWSVFVPQALITQSRLNVGAKLAMVWIAVVFIFFSISKTQLVTYIFPLYPLAAILVASLWQSAIEKPELERGLKIGLSVNLVLSVLICVFIAGSAVRKYPESLASAIVMGAILVVGTAVALILFMKKKSPLLAICPAMAVFAAFLVAFVMPPIQSRISTKNLVRNLRIEPNARVFSISLHKPSLLFYMDRQPENVKDVSALKKQLPAAGIVYVICNDLSSTDIAAMNLRRIASSGGLSAFTRNREDLK